jgi:hypothetical protein
MVMILGPTKNAGVQRQPEDTQRQPEDTERQPEDTNAEAEDTQRSEEAVQGNGGGEAPAPARSEESDVAGQAGPEVGEPEAEVPARQARSA